MAIHRDHVRAICVFHFLTLINEAAAFDAAAVTLRHLKIHSMKSLHGDNSLSRVMVTCLDDQWRSGRRRHQHGEAVAMTGEDWILPTGISLGAWMEFRRDSDPDELFALLCTRVLGVPDADVAAGIGATEGTVRHRVARALRRLGNVSLGGARRGG